MLGAIIGDIIGSRFEWHNIKTKEFELFSYKSRPTDDSIMTLALAKAILDSKDDYSDLGDLAVDSMQSLGRKYPNCGYGGRFKHWVFAVDPKPYQSLGNGSAMRVSPAGYAAKDLAEAKLLSQKITEVTHDHPEGLKGAEAVVVAIYMAKNGCSRQEIKDLIDQNYYPMDFTLEAIRPTYKFDATCQGTVPQALMAFFESTSFEDAIRNAISIGGDSDTIACMAGAVAAAFFGIPKDIREAAQPFLEGEVKRVYQAFIQRY